MTVHVWVPSPIDDLCLAAKGDALAGLYMQGHLHVTPDGWGEEVALARAPQVLRDAAVQLAEYFEGRRQTFDLPLAAAGTPFQHGVWDKVSDIGYGDTWTYGEIAEHIGRPSAARAAGHAIGRNPISIIVPCHRVVGASGRLVGYGGGVRRKQFLLDLERRHTALL